jgi:4-hydroxy-tetrahydrodipicolinate reductase
MFKVGLFGGSGRVGQRLIELLKPHQTLELGAVFIKDLGDFPDTEGVVVTQDVELFLKSIDLVIDFSLPEATENLLEGLIAIPKKAVIGTTGLSPHQQHLMIKASETSPILYATNMSLGVALLNQLVLSASKSLKDFDIEIVEMHHRHKKDAPSGTALTLAESAAKGRDLDINSVRISGRDGNIGARTKDEISVMALRGGDIVGRHTVGFYNDGEFIELNHTATSRDTFAKGALHAGEWLLNRESGLYDIKDCLDF